MFTGIVKECGRVAAVEHGEQGARLRVRADLASELEAGNSIAVNGVCLTASTLGEGEFAADLSPETLARTTLGEIESGSVVNLELPLRAQDRLDGHIVQGHVDGVGTLAACERNGAGSLMRFSTPAELLRYLAEKGSVAVDGISLTVATLHPDGFSVAVIPETLERTNLTELGVGARVNLETDVIAKYLDRLAAQ